MSKADYILRSLSKISKKRWEHYVINRIFHRLDDPDVEFVCQQCVRKQDGKIYLTDLFFPQINLYLEIDEGHHENDEAKKNDAKRNFDIVEATGFEEERISVVGITLEEANKEIEKFIVKIRTRKDELVAKDSFHGWDYKHRFTAYPHLESGRIEIGPNSAFRTHKDALNCFGYNKGHLQKAVWNMPPHVSDAIGLRGKCVVWFPKLYEQPGWSNSLSDDGKIICEINKNLDGGYDEPWDMRIVMGRSRDELNRILYRFLGVFEVMQEYRNGREHRFRRVATSVKTYSAEK